MQIRSVRYPLIAIFELFRALVLLKLGALSEGSLPITWYAGIPLLAVMPFAFFALSLDEEGHASWLAPAALVKAMCAVSLAAYAVVSFPDAIRFGSAGDARLFTAVAAAAFFGIADTIIGIYCFRRYRILCK